MSSTPSNAEVSKLIAQLKAIKHDQITNEDQRQDLYAALTETALEVESPHETVDRIVFNVLHAAVIKVGIELDLFTKLDKNTGTSLSVEELADATGSSPELLIRLLRYLATTGAIEQLAADKFAASKTTKVLSDPGMAAGMVHGWDNLTPSFHALPQFLAGNKYRLPTDNAHTAYQLAHKTELPAFIYAAMEAQKHPKAMINFGLWMQANKAALPDWLDVVPIETLCPNTDPAKPIFVDIGGSIGHQSAALKQKYPDLQGQIIYQDLPMVIEHGLKVPGVEAMVYDFYQPQPIKGASIYYLRNILHDYPDEKCLAILANISAAMDETSVICIDEMILSDFKPYYQAAEMDLLMMLTLAGAERTDKQWEALIDAAGLKVKEIFTYNKLTRQSVLVLVRK